MTANKKTLRSILRTQLQDYVRNSKRGQHATVGQLADELLDSGEVDREVVFQLFAAEGFHNWIRKEASKTDPTTGRPMLTAVGYAIEEDEDGAQRKTQKLLFVSTKWADFEGRVFDFKQKIRMHERDRHAARLLWQQIAEDFYDEVRKPDAYQPPAWLFDESDLNGGA